MRTPRRRWWVYTLLFLLVAINYMDRSALSVAASPISEEFGLSPGQMGLLLSTFLWTYLLCLIPAGILTDRIGTRWTNAISIAVWSAATVLAGIVRGFGALVGARLLMGVGESTTYPACGRVVQEWAPASERGRVVATYNSGAYAGPALGSLLTAALVTAYGWRTAFVVLGGIGFVWLAAWLIWFRDPADARWLGEEERETILRERGLAQEEAAGTGADSAGVLELLRHRSMWGVALVQSAAVYTQYLFLTWLPGYLEQARGLSVLRSGAFTAIPYVVAMVLGIAIGVVVDRLLSAQGRTTGRRRLVVAGFLLVSSVVLLTPFVGSITLVLVLISISLTCVSSAVSMNLALLADLLRSPRLAGRANGIAMVGGNTFGIAAPIVTGYVVQATGSYTAAFVVAGVFLLLGTTVALTMTRTPIGRADPAPEPTAATA
ncbi:MFS transporter [Pseudonocardia zijingensis]|jgi:ACS family glucarate transporter-like MFS transporter|uniref:MFS transporter n=1 Tax=Pseudonocardia zijingensis TaxID=153376 RepID=A0ABP4A1V6_9PSEU